MRNYYFLITAFPPLHLGLKPEISYKELKDLLVLNLSEGDLQKVKELLRPIDLYNIRAFWLGLPLDDRGDVQVKDIEEELLVKEALPPYVADFLDRYETTEERLRYFSSLYVSMYSHLAPKLQGFLKKYYQFEREVRLILTGLRAKQANRNLVFELQFEDPTDPMVADLLSQKEALDYLPPVEYEDLKTLFVENSSRPQKLNEAILEYRFRKIEEMEEAQDFSVDRVLAYVAKFLIAESLSGLDKEKGNKELRQYE